MRIFVAGASGVLGVRVLPLLAAAGHDVSGMTRSPSKGDVLRRAGAEPAICDVFDLSTLRREVADARPARRDRAPRRPSRARARRAESALVEARGAQQQVDERDRRTVFITVAGQLLVRHTCVCFAFPIEEVA